MRMNKIELIGTDQDIYFEKLPCGLSVYLIPYKDKNNYYANYFTNFGSVDLEFTPNDSKKMITVPSGIAHFLEHKMFEQKEGDAPFVFYAKSGTGSNASTSYKTTKYYIYGTNNLKENLTYLLDYVNSPYFTDENVEKEKGIIIEEVKMYDDNPEWLLMEKLQKSTFHVHPIRLDMAGYPETVNAITKDQLYDCYNTFYNPSNMALVVAGNFDVDEIMEEIKNNEKLKAKEKLPLPKRKKIDEKYEIHEKLKEITINTVTNPKIGYAIKLSIKNIKDDIFEYNTYIGMIIQILFGNSSTFREKMLKKNLMSSMLLERQIIDDFLVINFWIESKNPKQIIEEVQKQLKNYKIDGTEVDRCKKVWISSEVIMTDNVEVTANNLIGDYIDYGRIIPNKIDFIRGMNLKRLEKIRNSIDLDNNATVVILPKDK